MTMTKGQKPIPAYFVTRKNTILQVLFASVFAYVFINIYRPFGAREWFNISWWEFSFYSGLLVIAGMLMVLASRILMFALKKHKPVTIRYYVVMVAGEIISMAVMYAFLEKYVMNDARSLGYLFYLALQNTALILLIPYVISLLFFSWQEKTINLNKLLKQLRHLTPFISFRDENGVLRISLKTDDLLYLESSDNYVSIKYLQQEKPKSVLVRNSLKTFEKEFENSILLRCHRSYMVNVKRVAMVKKEGHKMSLLIEGPDQETIPVSRGYHDVVKHYFDNKIE